MDLLILFCFLFSYRRQVVFVNGLHVITLSLIINLIFFVKTGSIKYMKLKLFFFMFICLVISCEFSTIIMLHSQFCRQFATDRSNNLYYCGFPAHLGAFIPFSDSGTLMRSTERWAVFF